MVINKNDIQEMIMNNDNFEVKMTIEIDDKKCKNVFMTYKNNKIDFTVDEWSNDEEIVSKVERLINYNKHYNLLNIIEHCTDIELLKNNDKILNVNNYIDFEQYNYYDMLERTNKLIIDYSVIYNQCRKTNNFILQDDVNERQIQLQKEYKDIIIELNNYYVENFDNNKIYDNEEDIYYYSDNKNNRYEELKKLLK